MAKMDLENLVKTQEYNRLTPKQRMFVSTYIQSGLETGIYDQVTAVKSAYDCKNEESARIMGYSMLANINVIQVLNRHFGTEPIDQFLVTLERAIRNRNLTVAQFHALKLYCDLKGFENALSRAVAVPPENSSPARKVRKARIKPAAVLPDSDVYNLNDFDQNKTSQS